MIGYWIVIAMIACAVSAVIVVSAVDPFNQSNPVSTLPSSRPIVIAALGASDATGEGTRDPARENWVAQLAAQLPADVRIENFGVGGSWLATAFEVQVPAAVAIEPDIVIGWLVVNDLTQGETLADYLDVLDRALTALAHPGRIILLGNAPQLWNLPAFSGDPDDIEELQREVETWNLGLSQVASTHGAIIVDLSQNQVAADDISGDGFHPSATGHAKLADTFLPQVLSAIESVRAARDVEAAD